MPSRESRTHVLKFLARTLLKAQDEIELIWVDETEVGSDLFLLGDRHF